MRAGVAEMTKGETRSEIRSETTEVFTMEYSLFTNSGSEEDDIQFGMNFSLTSTVKRPLSQLIFPATLVGTNRPGEWNIDNHNEGDDLESLIFTGAEGGTITDGPREISHRGEGVLNTKFAVYLLDLDANSVQSVGVKFGYSINTSSDVPPGTTFIDFVRSEITNEQKNVMLGQAPNIRFV